MDPVHLVIQWLCFIDITNIVTEYQTQRLEVARVKTNTRFLEIMFNFPRRRSHHFRGNIMVLCYYGGNIMVLW